MIFPLLICIFSFLGLILFIIFKPSLTIKGHTIPIYFLPALIGGIILIACNFLSFQDIWQGLTFSKEMNPLKIIILFLSLTFLSVFLDEIGFFKKLASILISKAGFNQKKLFFFLYFLISFLTIFTSNDIIILTFTPFICFFCKNQNINPVPYLVSEFVAANTWSMALMIGNPTNIYLSSSCEIDFLGYLSVMWLPTILAGASSLFVLFLLFRKKLSAPCTPEVETIQIADKGLLIIGLIELIVCIIALAISSWIKIPMWIISLASAITLILITFIYSKIHKVNSYHKIILSAFKRVPWEMIPFILSMFVIVLSLEKYGFTQNMYDVLSGNYSFIKYGVSSLLISNIINNIPMSILYGEILANNTCLANVYATIIGSNIGAYLTPIGALAGIMWTRLLNKYDIKFSFKKFIGYGSIICIVSLSFALLGLYLTCIL